MALFFVAAYALEWARFSPSSIIAARVLLSLAVLGSVYYFLIRPLRRRVTDEQVALYLEEHEPSLQATLISAVEASGQGGAANRRPPRSCAASSSRRSRRALLPTQSAVSNRCRSAAGASSSVSVAAAAILIVVLGPAFLRSALSALLLV